MARACEVQLRYRPGIATPRRRSSSARAARPRGGDGAAGAALERGPRGADRAAARAAAQGAADQQRGEIEDAPASIAPEAKPAGFGCIPDPDARAWVGVVW